MWEFADNNNIFLVTEISLFFMNKGFTLDEFQSEYLYL